MTYLFSLLTVELSQQVVTITVMSLLFART